MNETHFATIANFNCTQKIEGKVIPLLEFFEEIVWPALNDKELCRTTGKAKVSKTDFYISDVKLVKINNSEDCPLAVVGKHIKRTILDIQPDYNYLTGFTGSATTSPSAPYSTFILLLNNHRVIYFPNHKGSPNVKAFSSTVSHIITKYVSKIRKELIYDHFKPTYSKKEKKYIYNGVEYKTIREFIEKYVDFILPYPETNIVAIESKDLVNEAFSKISKIKNISFKFYKPNNEALNFNNFFESCYGIIEQTKSTALNQTLKNPEKTEVIQEGINSSGGKIDFTINAVDENNENIRIEPESVSQKVPITVNDEEDVVIMTSNIYNQVKERSCIKDVSDDNKITYDIKKDSIASLMD